MFTLTDDPRFVDGSQAAAPPRNLPSRQRGIDRLLWLRVVRCLPLRAHIEDLTPPAGQAADKPRGRKPRGGGRHARSGRRRYGELKRRTVARWGTERAVMMGNALQSPDLKVEMPERCPHRAQNAARFADPAQASPFGSGNPGADIRFAQCGTWVFMGNPIVEVEHGSTRCVGGSRRRPSPLRSTGTQRWAEPG